MGVVIIINKKRKRKRKKTHFFSLFFEDKKNNKKMSFSFPHAPFPGPTVSDSFASASRAAGDAYARRVLRLRDDKDREERAATKWKKQEAPLPLLLVELLPSCCSSSSIYSLPSASEPSTMPPTDSLALLGGLDLKKNDKEDNYGRVLALSSSPSQSQSPSTSSSSSSFSSFSSLPRPTLLDLTRDEDSVSV